MKKVLTIDFDILMHQSINIYNDYDNDVNEFLLDFPFINQLPIDLELYENLTNFLLQIPKNKIVFIKDHDEIVKLTRNEGPFTLINLDHHHDLGYGDNIRWNIPVKQVDVGNWVKKLWDLNRVNKYIWLKDNNSYDPPSRAQKYLTEKQSRIFESGADRQLKILQKKIIMMKNPEETIGKIIDNSANSRSKRTAVAGWRYYP